MRWFPTFTFMLLLLFDKVENTHSSLLLENIEEISILNRFLMNLLMKYKEFLIVFHVDLETEDSVDHIVQYFEESRTLISFAVINYDKLQIEAEEFVRPEVPHVLNLLFPKNVSYWHWLNGYDKINYNDVIVFVADNWNLRERIVAKTLKIIKHAGKVLLLESVDNTRIQLYQTCFYCGNLSRIFVPANYTTKDSLLNDFQDLNGHLLHVIFVPNYPYLHCKQSEKLLWKQEEMNVCLTLSGIEGHMIRLIGRKMNFKYMAFMLESNVTYLEMLKYVNAKKADFAFGAITLSVKRISLIQFTQQFHAEAFTFVYRSSRSFGEFFEKFLDPLRPPLVWFLFLVSMVLLSTVLCVILKVHKTTGVRGMTLPKCLWILFHMPLEQAIPQANSVYRGLSSSGLVLALSWWCCLVFGAMYKSMLLSALVYPENREPEDLRQLLDAGYRIVTNERSSDIVRDILNISDSLYSDKLGHIEFGKNACDAFSKIIDNRVAMLEELSTIQYGIPKGCPKPDAKAYDRLRITRYPVRVSGHAWATQLGAPYQKALDHYLGLILSGGLFVKWKRDTASLGVDKPIPLSREKRNQRVVRLAVQAFHPVFVIYGVGILLSTLCLIMEMLYFAYRLHQRRRMQIRYKTKT